MSEDRFQSLRLLEAMLFANTQPVGEAALAARLPEGTPVPALLEELAGLYANRGVNLVCRDGGWAFRTAPDLGGLLQIEKEVVRKLSRAAVETLAIIAYHQPVTRAEIEEIRGVALSKGTLDTLLEAGWIRPRGRRQTPGRPVTWGTSTDFLDHFGLARIEDLPGVEELKAAGLLDRRASVTTIAMRAEDQQAEQQESEEEGEVEEIEEIETDEEPEEPDQAED